MALTLVYSSAAFMNGARKDDAIGRFCPPCPCSPCPGSGRDRGGGRAPPALLAAPGTRAPWFNAARDKGSFGTLQAFLGLLSTFAPGSSPSAVRATRGIADGSDTSERGCAEAEIAAPSFGFSLARVAVAGPDGDGDSPP